MLGVSPKTSASLPAPASTTTAPESMPTLTDTLGVSRLLVEFRHPFKDSQASERGAFSIIFVGLRPAEVGHYAVTKVLGDVATITGDRVGRSAMVGGNHLAPLLWVKLRGDFGRAHQIAEQHRQM